MPVVMKKRHINEDIVTIRLRVHRNNVPKLKEYAQILENEDEYTYSISEVFPEYSGKAQQVAIRAYRYRENFTQRQLSELTGISQYHLSEIENGKRIISKEQAKVLARVLNTDCRMFQDHA
jgi:DNA-binding XRE family transcriptional regulator